MNELRNKVGRLFVVRPESLDPSIRWKSDLELPEYALSSLNRRMRAFAREYPVGGVVLFGHNIQSPGQLRSFTAALKTLPGRPLVCIDEEGGRVSRIARNPAFDVPRFESCARIAESDSAYSAARSIGHYLKEYGFDLDFAPLADVNTNPDNPVIGTRAFSSDPSRAAAMVSDFVRGLLDEHIQPCLKHFPGHGDTSQDTHSGFASISRGWDSLLSCGELQPFLAGIDAGAKMVMVAHICAREVTGDSTPSSLSKTIIEDKLRSELGFDGVVITDALEMGAITEEYSSAEAAVKAILAGADMLLAPLDFREAFDAVVDAVERGIIPKSRIDSSLARIQAFRQD